MRVLLSLFALALAGAGDASAEDGDAARAAAGYHMMFLVEHVVPPFRLPDDALLTCTLEGQPVTIFRGDPRLQAGRSVAVDVPCWPSAERQPEPAGPTRYYYEDPSSPRTLILWANREGEHLVAVDWVGMD